MRRKCCENVCVLKIENVVISLFLFESNVIYTFFVLEEIFKKKVKFNMIYIVKI